MHKTMKALQLHATWRPRQAAVAAGNHRAEISSDYWADPTLELLALPVPEPAPDEVLLQVRACGVCGSGIFNNIIRLLAAGQLPAAKMITHRFQFENVLEAFRVAGLRDGGKVMVSFTRK